MSNEETYGLYAQKNNSCYRFYSGIGLEIAQLLAEEGADVVLHGLSTQEGRVDCSLHYGRVLHDF